MLLKVDLANAFNCVPPSSPSPQPRAHAGATLEDSVWSGSRGQCVDVAVNGPHRAAPPSWPATQVQARLHPMQAAKADGLGRHALFCIKGGQKTIAHNRVRGAVRDMCSFALLAVRKEAHPWGDGQRMDPGDSKRCLIDIADTSTPRPRSTYPVVGDVLGAWGRTALSFLKDIASAYAKRYPHVIAGKVHFYSTLNTQLMRLIAAFIYRSITPLEA